MPFFFNASPKWSVFRAWLNPAPFARARQRTEASHAVRWNWAARAFGGEFGGDESGDTTSQPQSSNSAPSSPYSSSGEP